MIEKCPFCEKQHIASDDAGFILNEFILKASELKPEKVYRCPSYDMLDSLVTNLNNDLNELTSKIEYPDIKIREHCDKIRNQIDLATETLLEKISKFREKFIDEINRYEQDCFRNNHNYLDTKTKEAFLKLVKENETKLAKSRKKNRKRKRRGKETYSEK